MRLEQGGDSAECRAHAGGGDNHEAASVGDRRAAEHHVAAIGDKGAVRLLDHLGRLVDGHRFAGERGFIDPKVGCLEQAPVGDDEVSRIEVDDVASNDVASREQDGGAITADPRLRRRHPP